MIDERSMPRTRQRLGRCSRMCSDVHVRFFNHFVDRSDVTFRLFRQWYCFRRFFACVVAVCVVSNVFEVLIPDVHEARAHTGRLASASSTQPGGETYAAMRAVSELTRSMSMALSGPVNNGSGCDQNPASPCHAFHLDHCSHSHLAALTHRTELPPVVSPHAPQCDTKGLDLISIEIAPHLRPPIA